MERAEIEKLLLEGLTHNQQAEAVKSKKRRLLVVAGAGSGKTDVMARRVAWWVGVEMIPKDSIVAFSFTERAAEEMKFRIRQYVHRITPTGEDATLGGMYVGTIHGFCLKLLRELDPDTYHNFEVIDEGARIALVQRGYNHILGLAGLQKAAGSAQFRTIQDFLDSYDLLNEYDELDVRFASEIPPNDLDREAEWCKEAVCRTNLGSGDVATTFAVSAARYYAFMRFRRFLDFSTPGMPSSTVCRSASSRADS